MLPLSLAGTGEDYTIKKIGGNPVVKKHLENMGFNVGSKAQVVTTNSGNLIVIVKETRVAISREMAQKIMV